MLPTILEEEEEDEAPTRPTRHLYKALDSLDNHDDDDDDMDWDEEKTLVSLLRDECVTQCIFAPAVYMRGPQPH